MWATLALTAVLGTAPAQGGLAIKNARPTYGVLGQDRKDDKFYVGDVVVLSFDIDGLKSHDDGEVLYSFGFELVDKNGKSQYKQEPKDLVVVNTLGGSRLPAFAIVQLGTDTTPGEYTIKLTVTDRIAKATTDHSYKFQAVPAKLGFVQTNLTDTSGRYLPVPPLAVPGQAYLINFGVVGFALEGEKKQPNVEVSMRVLENDKPVLGKPATGGVKEVGEENKKLLIFQFPLFLQRTGKFTIELTVKDVHTGKSEKQLLNLTVVDVPK
jgi:hypothetical protein